MSTEKAVIERNTLQMAMEVLQSIGGHTSPIPMLEEEVYRLRDLERDYLISPVERHDYSKLYNAPPAGGAPGKVSYFLDTNQRTQLIGHFLTEIGLQVPVHYSIVMCIILERRARQFKVWHAPKLEHLIVIPFAHLGKQINPGDFPGGVKLVDSDINSSDYTQLRVQSIHAAHAQLELIKLGQLAEWREETANAEDQYLLHNGSNLENPNAALGNRVIGWSKNVYLPFIGSKEANVGHLELKSFQRTAVFKLRREADQGATEKYMWYIKLREHSRYGPEFGLIKPELVASSDEEAIDKADWLTHELLKERQPATFPATNWDKLIFPIKLCRTYLEGIVPTHETIRSYFDRS